MTSSDPQMVTIAGRLSFPNLTQAQAVVQNGKSNFPDPDEKIAPSFFVVVKQSQIDKLIEHAETEFLPWCVQQGLDGQKRSALTQAEADKILAFLKAEDWTDAPPHTPIKAISAKQQDMIDEKAPGSVATIKVSGRPGVDIIQSAQVNDKSELKAGVDVKSFPNIVPVGQVEGAELYPGSNVAVTLNMFAFVASKVPGYTASATTVVFKGHNARFGGGAGVDEDEIFMDADD